ncbi:preprotein translocase subunit SecE [Candidatus Kapabacteria bacterium]|nr:preprotein translocase subunit SecE [Candidatus Kapabacteria bacterium]
MIESIKKFVADVQSEMKKVTWPTREQLTESTNVVIGVTLVITALVFVIDFGLKNILELIF